MGWGGGWGGGVTADDDRGCYDPVDPVCPPFDPEFDVTVFDVPVFDVTHLYRKFLRQFSYLFPYFR